MPYGNPVNPVGGTVITVAYAVSNLLDPIRWLRIMTGNSDPPGSAYALVSTSTTAAAWQKVTADALASGAVTTHLGYTPVNRAGDSMTGGLAITGAASDLVVARNIGAGGTIQSSVGVSAPSVTATAALSGDTVNAGTYFNGGTKAQGTINVNTLRVGPGGVVSDAQVSGDTVNAGTYFNGGTKAQGTINVNTLNVGPGGVSSDAAIRIAGVDVRDRGGHTGTQLAATISNLAATVATLDAASVAGKIPTTTPSAGALPLADASGKLDAWVTPSGGSGAVIPPGLIAFIATGALPTGWAFYTAANGRVIVAAGSASVGNPQTFTVGTNYGGDWSHLHGAGGLTASVGGSATGGPTDNTGASTAVNGLAAAGGVNLNTTGHTHPLDGVSLAVSASGGVSGNTAGVVWVPPSHALNAIIKT